MQQTSFSRHRPPPFPSIARHSGLFRDHLDRVYGTLLETRPAAGAAVVVEPVARPHPSLITASSGHAPGSRRTRSSCRTRHRPDCRPPSTLRPPTTSPKSQSAPRGKLRLPARAAAEVPGWSLSKAWSSPGSATRLPRIDLPGRLLAVGPTVAVRRWAPCRRPRTGPHPVWKPVEPARSHHARSRRPARRAETRCRCPDRARDDRVCGEGLEPPRRAR
jgi:hypothetical protein